MHVNYFSGFLAQATAPAQSGAPLSSAQALLNQAPFFILIAVMFYFILIRPQQQRAKAQAKMLATIKAGDKVVTASGIVGVIITVKDKTVSLRSADAKFEVTKGSITEVLEASNDGAPTVS
jgi:preprotein translocase subunit YajC